METTAGQMIERPRRVGSILGATLAGAYLLLIAATHAGCASYFTRPDVMVTFLVGILGTVVLLLQGLGRWSAGRLLSGAAFGALAGIVFSPSIGALLSAALLVTWLADRRNQIGSPLDIAIFLAAALGSYQLLRVMVAMTPPSLFLGC